MGQAGLVTSVACPLSLDTLIPEERGFGRLCRMAQAGAEEGKALNTRMGLNRD
jgi:hypothetical protein